MIIQKCKQLTIVTEATLEHILGRELEALGAHGYTIMDARGKGRHGERAAGWDMSSNILIELVCEEQTALAIAAHFHQHYADDFALIVFMSDVDVLRPGNP